MVKKDEESNKSKKPSKKLIYLLIIFIVILAEGLILYYDYTTNADDNIVSDITESVPYASELSENIPFLNSSEDNDYAVEPLKPKVIGKNDIGTVSVEGPYGNDSSPVKIAYILGQHPREYNAHDAIYNSLLNGSNNLSYSYYVYRINVSGESEDFEQSRMNGQLLAQEFVVNDSVKNNYSLVIDIHSSNGGYIQDPYIFAPVSSDAVANESANNLSNNLSYLVYYEPASYSSPQYSTIPIEEGGIPAIVFEMRGNPDNTLENQANDFVNAVDKLLLK